MSFLRFSLKSLQHRLILTKKINTMNGTVRYGTTASSHNQSGQKEYELLKSQFLSIISHELRTPLQVIMGNLSLVLEGGMGDLEEGARLGLTRAMEGSYHMLSLVNNLLDFVCLSAGDVRLERHLVDVAGFLKGLAQEWRVRARNGRVVLLEEIPTLLPKIKTNRNALEKILSHLLDNAFKFTPQGSIVLGVCLRGDALEIRVADTGIGISREARELIFTAFRQADGTDTRPYQGMGLGLALSKKLVSLLGGKIDVESEADRGSTFRVILPRERPPCQRRF